MILRMNISYRKSKQKETLTSILFYTYYSCKTSRHKQSLDVEMLSGMCPYSSTKQQYGVIEGNALNQRSFIVTYLRLAASSSVFAFA